MKKLTPDTWNRPRLRTLLEAMSGKRVLVLGDIGVDLYTTGQVERISPEAPVPIVQVESERLKLGLAANVADNIRALGGVPLLVGVVGMDRGAEDFRRILSERGISETGLIEDPSRRTALKQRLVSESQQLLRVDYETTTPIATAVAERVRERALTLLKGVDAVIVEDYAKGLLSEALVGTVLGEARRLGIRSFSDPSGRLPASFYRGSDVLTPNRREAEYLSRRSFSLDDPQSIQQAGHAVIEMCELQDLVLTLGRDGMVLLHRDREDFTWIPTHAREVFDVSGAGDTVISVLALAQAAGASLEEAAVLGNIAAGIEVAKWGTATVAPDEIDAVIRPD